MTRIEMFRKPSRQQGMPVSLESASLTEGFTTEVGQALDGLTFIRKQMDGAFNVV